MKNDIFSLDFFCGFIFCKFHEDFANFKNLKKIVHAKIYPNEICLNMFYDALFKTFYSSDSLTGSCSTARKNNKLMVKIASWFLPFC